MDSLPAVGRVDEVDRRAADLTAIHADHLTCKPGCCDCCLTISVWPVEFEAIRQALIADGVTNRHTNW